VAIWSLHAQNEASCAEGSHLFCTAQAADAAERPAQDLKIRSAFLQYQLPAESRSKAHAKALDSFKSLDSELAHISIAVGNPEGREGGFRSAYGSSLLVLSLPRRLQKASAASAFLAYTLLACVRHQRLIYNSTDDIRLLSGPLSIHLHESAQKRRGLCGPSCHRLSEMHRTVLEWRSSRYVPEPRIWNGLSYQARSSASTPMGDSPTCLGDAELDGARLCLSLPIRRFWLTTHPL